MNAFCMLSKVIHTQRLTTTVRLLMWSPFSPLPNDVSFLSINFLCEAPFPKLMPFKCDFCLPLSMCVEWVLSFVMSSGLCRYAMYKNAGRHQPLFSSHRHFDGNSLKQNEQFDNRSIKCRQIAVWAATVIFDSCKLWTIDGWVSHFGFREYHVKFNFGSMGKSQF